MSSLRDAVKDYQDELRDGIAWVAFWREGQSWESEYFSLEMDDTIHPLNLWRLREAQNKDPAAVVLNAHYCVHLAGDMNLDELTAGVRWHYENGYNLLSDFINSHSSALTQEEIEQGRAAASTAGLPFSDKPYRSEDYDPAGDFDPYVFDGSMSIEDYELMHRTIAEESNDTKVNELFEHMPLNPAGIPQNAMTEQEFLDLRGIGDPMSGYMIDKLKGNRQLKTQRGQDKFFKEVDEANKKYFQKRQNAREEYKNLVERGVLRDKTPIERSLTKAHENPKNESTQAARRMLEKRGIDWQTGKKKGAKMQLENNEIEKISLTTKYEIVEATTEHRLNQKYYEGIAFELDEDQRIIESYSSLEEAKEALSKHRSSCVKQETNVGTQYYSTEFYIVKNDYDAEGELFVDTGNLEVYDFAILGLDDSHHKPEQYEIDFIAAYEDTHNIPADERLTRWFGDYSMNELSSNYYNPISDPKQRLDMSEKVFVSRLEEAMEAAGIWYTELETDVSQYHSKEMRDMFANVENQKISEQRENSETLAFSNKENIGQNPSAPSALTVPTNRALTKDEFDKLTGEIAEIAKTYEADPDLMVEYLAFKAQFYQYSPANALLIKLQNPHATFVASFTKWKDLGYSVKKGEHHIKIRRPIEASYFLRSENGKEIITDIKAATAAEKAKIATGDIEVIHKTRFVPTQVFDISQTDCPPSDYPKIYNMGHPDMEQKQLYECVKDYAQKTGFTVTEEDLTSISLKGYYNRADDTIHLSNKLNDSARLEVMCHELAHGVLHKTSTQPTEIKEFEAECFAAMLKRKMGYPVSEESKRYISSYYKKAIAKNPKFECNATLDRLSKAFKHISTGIDETIAQAGYGLDREQSINLQQAQSKAVDVSNISQNFMQAL